MNELPPKAARSLLDKEPCGVAFTLCLLGLSGWIDSTGLVHSGMFVSFMSGNTTTLGLFMRGGHWKEAIAIGVVLVAFVAGGIVGEALASVRVQQRGALVLILVAALLGAATVTTLFHGSHKTTSILLAFAMGVQSAANYRVGTVQVAVTHVTGILVKFARHLSARLMRRASGNNDTPYGGLWLALLLGATLGGAVAARSETVALVASTGFAIGLTAASWRRQMRDPEVYERDAHVG